MRDFGRSDSVTKANLLANCKPTKEKNEKLAKRLVKNLKTLKHG